MAKSVIYILLCIAAALGALITGPSAVWLAYIKGDFSLLMVSATLMLSAAGHMLAAKDAM